MKAIEPLTLSVCFAVSSLPFVVGDAIQALSFLVKTRPLLPSDSVLPTTFVVATCVMSNSGAFTTSPGLLPASGL